MMYYEFDVNPHEYIEKLIERSDQDSDDYEDSRLFFIIFNKNDFRVYDIVDDEETAYRITCMLIDAIGEDVVSFHFFNPSVHVSTAIGLRQDPKKALSSVMKMIGLLKKEK